MSFNEMKDLYKRSVVYQFVFFFYSVIMVNYLQEPMMKNVSLIMMLLNLWLMVKTTKEYSRKKELYINPEQ